MTRKELIERIRRQIYNGQPSDDATITVNLVNSWLSDAIALAAKTNYTDNVNLTGIGFVNNSFYSNFEGIALINSGQNIYKATLPELPMGLGSNDGISDISIKDNASKRTTLPIILLSKNQSGVYRSLRDIPNKLLGFNVGKYLYIDSTMDLTNYTLNVSMVSGGTSSDLTSELNVPGDYLPAIIKYIQQQLLLEKSQPVDANNDGNDFSPQIATV